MSILKQQQKQQFIDDGYTVVSGLIPPETIATAREKICERLGIAIDDPATWPERERALGMDAADLTPPCFTPQVNTAAAELVGDIVWPSHSLSPHRDKAGQSPYMEEFVPVIAYPRAGEKQFDLEWPANFHIDGIQFASLWPDKMLLVALIYLTDTTEYGGATAVIPGSHRQVFEHWVQQEELPDERRHKEMLTVLEDPQPVAAPGQAGDVLFMHHLLAHSGSPNRDEHVRLALNGNFPTRPECEYQRKSGAPQDDWTPLDWTLRTDNIEEK